MEKTCRTCVHRKNYECTCKELRESIFPKIVLYGMGNAIEEHIINEFDDFLLLSRNIDTNDDAYDEMVEFIERRKVGENIANMIEEQMQDIVSLELDLSNDFVCKYWR